MHPFTINYKEKTIELTKSFAKVASHYGTEEYKTLAEVRKDFPNYEVIIKAPVKRKKDSFKGLTYGYMESYLKAKEESEENKKLLEEFNNLRSKENEVVRQASYGEIKAWFLGNCPEIKDFLKARENILTKPKPAA